MHLLGRLLRVVEKARFNPGRELRDQIFSLILMRLGEPSRFTKEQLKFLAAAKNWIPGGLHDYYLEYGMPEGLARQDQDRVRDLPKFLWNTLQEDDERNGTFDRSLTLAAALFADRDLPTEISDVIGSMALNRANALREAMEATWHRRSSSHQHYTLVVSKAAELLAENERVICLYRILHGEDRLAYEPSSNRVKYGLEPYDVVDLKSFIEQRAGTDNMYFGQSQSGKRRKGKKQG